LDYASVLWIAIGLSAGMCVAWTVQRHTGNSGWIDTIWSFSVGAGGIAATWSASGDPARRMAIAVILAVWSARLALHIAARSRGSGEDPRYRKMIEDWGQRASLRLFIFLQVQALVAFVLVLSVSCAGMNEKTFPRLLDYLGVLLALLAIGGEAVADQQLASFRQSRRAKNEVCEIGLWRYTRHPNYFFEWLFWCAWPFFALPHISGLIALSAPLLMYWLLVHLSGIPPLEAHMERSRGEEFRALKERVNAFFPGPRKGGSRN